MFNSHHENIYLICLYDSSHLHEGLSDLPLKPLIKPFFCRGASLHQQERSISENEGTERNLNDRALLSLPLFTILTSPFPITSSHDLTLQQTWHKKSGATVSSGLYFLLKAPVSCKTSINAFLWLIFVTEVPVERT